MSQLAALYADRALVAEPEERFHARVPCLLKIRDVQGRLVRAFDLDLREPSWHEIQ